MSPDTPARTDPAKLLALLERVDAAADGTVERVGVPTGFPSLDSMLGGGVRGGDLIALGGDVGVGKSALALAIALRTAARGLGVRFLSGEMTTERLLERALAIEGRVSIDALRQGTVDETARAALGAATLRLREMLPYFGPLAPTAKGVAAEIRQTRNGGRTAMVVVDSLEALATGASQKDEELAAAVATLKGAAIEGDVPVILTTQLPGVVRDRPDPRPTLDDFGALGSVKQLADVVLGLYREELYQAAPGHEGATQLAVLKNRNGPLRLGDLYFFHQWLRFEDIAE